MLEASGPVQLHTTPITSGATAAEAELDSTTGMAPAHKATTAAQYRAFLTDPRTTPPFPVLGLRRTQISTSNCKMIT